MTLLKLLQERREVVLRAAAARGAFDIRVFGSVAREEERSDSDIDLLVKWRPGTSLLDHAALMLELERLLGRKVEIASDGWIRPDIRASVYQDARPL
ncbi:MAG: nucleotidyltransferase domain-containing protein [Bryobacterales bacterium]|nr:nucleotidyltransferase domain-containing protein [Bryobacterales bacterium]